MNFRTFLPRLCSAAAAACAALACSLAFGQQIPQPRLPIVDLQSGMYLIKAEVAGNYGTRMIGMMGRQEMAPNEGMLFLFPVKEKQCMWMKNTLLPLSVAFIDENGVILNIEDMKPQTEDSHCSIKPAPYALEMNLGWFKQKGIKAGTKLVGIEKAGKAQP
jgi:uncharacterized membrane protein (UPF0127 family)